MTVTAAILSILAGLVPVVVLLVRRRLAKQNDPGDRFQETRNEINREMVRNDSRAANARLDRWLSELRRRAGRQNGGPPPDP